MARDADAQRRRGGGCVGCIRTGTKPRVLPGELPTKFESVANLKTAQAIRLTHLESILVRTDEPVE
jgi:hypothetical protein